MTPFDCLDELEVLVYAILTPNTYSPFSTVHSLTQDISDPINAIAVLQVLPDNELYNTIVDSYGADPWCTKVLHTQMDSLIKQGCLLFYKGCLVILCTENIWETILALAHNTLGYFGFDKIYAMLWDALLAQYALFS